MDYRYTGDAAARLHASYQADQDPFPHGEVLGFPPRRYRREEVDLLKRLFFPRCWNTRDLLEDEAAVGESLSELGQYIVAGSAPYGVENPTAVADGVINELPALRKRVKNDVVAAYKGDPAANSHVEVIRSYPGVLACLVHRVAHALYSRSAVEYARELSEFANSVSGVDIHPGAELGEFLFIDHGSGVVIGETATVGDWVRLYQDVTLGALHFEEDEDDERMLKKGYKRHPDIGNNVVIGAGTKVLGTVNIGDHVSIGANSWVTEDIPDHTEVIVAEHPKQVKKQRK